MWRKIAGVAISTVSLALNQPERVSKKTFRKVMDAAEQAGYSANPIAKSLKLGRSPIISMIVADIRTSFWQGFVQGMEAEAYRKQLPREPLEHDRRPNECRAGFLTT